MNKIRWGLLSTARINQALIPAIRKSKQGELAAVASRGLERAREYAHDWDIPHAYGSYQDLLDSGEVDAVYIGLPNHLHAEWTVKALQGGLHVLCEKPFAISLQEVDSVIAASQESGAVAAEGFMYRHHPQPKLVKEWIRRGNLGELLAIQGSFTFRMGDEERRPETLNVRLVPEYGGGSLWDVGIYPMSYTQYLLDGPPEWVAGSMITGLTGIDEVFAGQMGYSTSAGSEVLAQISSSFKSPYHTHMSIFGTEGQLLISNPFHDMDKAGSVVFRNNEGSRETIPVPQKSHYLGEVEDLHSAIMDGTPTLISLTETRDHILTALALYESARLSQALIVADYSPQE